MRYLTGLPFDEGEVAGSGDSGKFLVSGAESIVLADSRYTLAVQRDAPESRLFECYNALADRWPELLAGAGVTRVAVEAMTSRTSTWERLQAATPDVELVPVEGWVEAVRQIKEPSEIERIAAACAVADRALAVAPAVDPAGRDGDGARPRPRVADAHGRRRAPCLRRRLPRRRRGGAAAWFARAIARSGAAPSCCSTSGRRSPVTGAT